MRKVIRFTAFTSSAVAAALLAACAAPPPQQVTTYPSQPYPAQTYPAQTYPAQTYPAPTYPAQTVPAQAPQGAYVEYGRITNIDYVQGSTTTSGTNPQVRNAVIGGVIGAVVGNVVGKNSNDGKNRTGATVLGAAGGAAVGSQVGKNQNQVATNPAYRVVVQTDQGVARVFEVPSPGDLRVGDRVRVDNGVIYRS